MGPERLHPSGSERRGSIASSIFVRRFLDGIDPGLLTCAHLVHAAVHMRRLDVPRREYMAAKKKAAKKTAKKTVKKAKKK
jgi:hypothetical protein